ncbi:hypothetical protein ACFWMX_12230 [Streptomyces sp. NPDC058378]|uniref:MGH1-like glycoside hydrolase domain-containing protein n=1 Tax=Streptomyces sp. NPDC058378 TaxID=3346469 RepID=UPI00365DC224
MGGRARPPHRVQPLGAARRVLPQPRLLALLHGRRPRGRPNWLLERGLRGYGQDSAADALRAAMLDAAGASSFAEYVDPFTAQARGTRAFGWTAALTLDLLAASRPADDGTTDTSIGART